MKVASNLLQRAQAAVRLWHDAYLLRASGWFDEEWYLALYPDVALSGVDPVRHYLVHGAGEGRDPSPRFSSRGYLDAYVDVRRSGTNPLVHYLERGRTEGRTPKPAVKDAPQLPHQCPVCRNRVEGFLPLPDYYTENREKYGYPYSPNDSETLNAEGWICPKCGASDRERLYALYLERRVPEFTGGDALLLDIAPSQPLARFIQRFKQIDYRTADLLMEGVDIVLDITNMPQIGSNSYDIIICSHVLEHVADDGQALSELYRVLTPGSWAIIMVPIILAAKAIDEDPQLTDVAERWRRFGQFDHVRLYNKSGFISRVEAAGFTLEQLGASYFGESVFEECGITGRSVLYVAEKKRAAAAEV